MRALRDTTERPPENNYIMNESSSPNILEKQQTRKRKSTKFILIKIFLNTPGNTKLEAKYLSKNPKFRIN